MDAIPTHRHHDRMLVVAEEDRDGRNTQPTRPTSQEGADPVDLTINIALDRFSGRRLPIDAIHAARPGRHGGNEKEPADDHDQGEPVEHRRLRRVVHCVVAEIVVPVVVQGISFGCGRQRRT